MPFFGIPIRNGLPIGLGSVAGFGVSEQFSPASLFSAGEQGAWYDPSDLTTLFQDSAGTTPVTAVTQPVGLMLDKSKSLALGPELVVNGDFSNGTTGWTGVNATLAVVGGAVEITTTVSGQARASQVVTTVAGRWYEARATIWQGTGAVNADLLISGIASSAVVSSTTPTSVVVRFLAASTSTTIRVGSNASAVVGTTYFADNISVKELPGNHAYQSTSTSRPVLQQDGNGKYYLAFDGTDDSLLTNSVNFTATDKMTVWAGVRKLSDAASGLVAELSANSSTNNGSFQIVTPDTAGATDYRFYLRGDTASTGYITPGFAAPITNVLSVAYDIGGADRATEVMPKVNGGIPTLVNAGSSAAGGGNFGNYPLYIGRRGGASLPFNGNLYSLIIRGAQSTASQISATETWVNGKTGAY